MTYSLIGKSAILIKPCEVSQDEGRIKIDAESGKIGTVPKLYLSTPIGPSSRFVSLYVRRLQINPEGGTIQNLVSLLTIGMYQKWLKSFLLAWRN